MNILLCGANGFIGRNLCDALHAAGHHVIRGVRTASRSSDIEMDYQYDAFPEGWIPRLRDIDVVINAVGILGESRHAHFDTVHRDTPIALFKACATAGVKRVIQISALGGRDSNDMTPYLRTKREADAFLMKTQLDWTILRPSLVVGVDGDSSRFFRTLASLPVVGLPGKGEQQLQPVHISDLCDAVVHAVSSNETSRRIIDVVGPAPISYRQMLANYRAAMGMPSPIWLPIPMSLMRISASVATLLPQQVFSPNTLLMLEQGSAADPIHLQRLIGHAPKSASQWFVGTSAKVLRLDSLNNWTVSLFRFALAFVWIWTGLISLGIYPVAGSLNMLAQLGLHGGLATTLLYGASFLDCAIGIATLLAPSCSLWRLQFAVIVGYSILITIFLPYFWLHPFGPILKNIPILVMLIALDATETH